MRTFDIGRTLSRTFQLIRDGIGGVGMFLLLATLIGQGVTWVLQWLTAEGLNADSLIDRNAATLAMFTSVWYFASLAFSLAAGAFNSAGATAGYLAVAEGREASFASCIAEGLAKLLPVLGLTILWSLGVVFGFLLLIVPGVLLVTIWAAALPALVNERTGVMEAFQRSRDLTRGSRLLVFVFLLLMCVLIYVPMVVFGGALVAGGAEQMADLARDGLNPLLVLGSAIYAWLIAMLIGAGLVSLYRELVDLNGNAPGAGLTEVFE